MFEGLDAIDWASMTHAYGTAADVPELLRGLASADAGTREESLDGMYGAVHHQGDVYECTLATIPFLVELSAAEAVPERDAVVRLLGSYAGRTLDWWRTDAPEPGSTHARARIAIAARWQHFAQLSTDADAAVRAAAVPVLSADADRAAATVALLRGRFAVEPETEVRQAILETLAELPGTGEWFAEVLASDASPQLRIAALTALLRAEERGAAEARRGTAGLDPAGQASPSGPVASADGQSGSAEATPSAHGSVPAGTASARPQPDPIVEADREPRFDLAEAATALMLSLYDAPAAPAVPNDRPATDTLLGAVRRDAAAANAGRRHPEAYPLLLKLTRAFGGRVADRTRLLTTLLRSASWEARFDAVPPASMLIASWRGDHGELIAELGEQLAADHPGLRERAATKLAELGEHAAPAADALAAAVEAGPRQAAASLTAPSVPWLKTWSASAPALGPAVRALTQLRDPRALPAVAWVLEQPVLPTGLGHVIACLGATAAKLGPTLSRRIGDPEIGVDDLVGLANAVIAFGDGADEVDQRTARRLRLDTARALLDREPGSGTLAVLGRLGPDVAELTAPTLREQLTVDSERTRAAAALALWRLTGDNAGVPELTRQLSGNRYLARSAADALAEFGSGAAAAEPELRRLQDTEIEPPWPRLAAAVARWRILGEVATVVPLLGELWTRQPPMRPHIAKCLVDMGSHAAPLLPEIRAELARPRRHGAGPEQEPQGHDVVVDELLLRHCRAITRRRDG